MAASRGQGGRLRIRLRITIGVAVVLITVTLAASLVTLNYQAATLSVQTFAKELLDPIASRIAERARAFLDVCSRSAALAADGAADAPAEGRLDAVDALGFALLREQPELFYVQFGDSEGAFQLVTRGPGGGLDSQRVLRAGGKVTSAWSYRDPGAPAWRIRERRVDRDETYDPRTRPWYVGALRSVDVHWTDVYKHAAGGQPVITAARAVRLRGGELAGVASATLSLAGLSSFLDGIHLRGRPARVFVVDSGGVLLASSSLARRPAASDTASAGALPTLVEAGSSEIAALASTPELRAALAGDAPPSLLYEADGRRWLCALRAIRLGADRTWIVGAVVPEDDFLGEVKAGISRSVAVSALVLAAFLVLALGLSGSIARPLRAIAEETERIRQLELDDRPLPDSVFEEIASINEVFASLKTGLRAFQKYVPFRLVRMLLAEGVEPRLGGRVEELTIFFSDIRGFATLAEGTEPAALAEVLGRYLQTMAQTVADHGGTVDKFIGDAVMAFWNAPRAVDDHAYQAVLAAVRCRDRIRDLDHGDALYTRIGLHTAKVMVGNFGAPERFAYTALGDGVNLAARLEGVNKEYGTQILVTEETHRLLAGRLACRRVDRIAVKGRSLPTDIHEVLGEPGAVPAALLDAARIYESALAAYFDRDFAGAARLFGEAEERRPGDVAAARMRERAARYLAEPPPPEWTGVFAVASK